MSFCAVDTATPSVVTNPPTTIPYSTPVTPAPGNPIARTDDYCGVQPFIPPAPPTPENPDEVVPDTFTFVAVDDTVLVQKNGVVTFNVGSALGTSSANKDYVMRFNIDVGAEAQPVVDFLVLSDTKDTVPIEEGTVSDGAEEGEYIFTPATDFVGDVTVWTYTATDFGTDGVTEDTASVKIRVIDAAVDTCLGLEWQGAWETGKDYKDGLADDCQNRDVVKLANNSCLFVCIKSHTSDDTNRPDHSTFDGAAGWVDYWEKMVEDTGLDSTAFPQISFLDNLYNGVFDWMKNATIGDWLGAIAIGAGVVWAGDKIIDSLTDSGAGDGNEDSRYNGSPTYSGSYTPPSLRSVCQSLCEEAGIAHYDVSALPTTISCHFSLSQQTSVRTVLDNLSRAFQFDMVDSAGILKFVPRNTNVVRTLTHDDLGFNTSNDVVAPVTMKRLQSVDLPRSVSLTYMAEDLDYNNYTQRSEISTFEAGNDINLTVPFMLTHDDAKEATDRLLIGAHLERMQYTFKTSYRNAVDLEPSDVVQIPEGTLRIVQIEEVDEGVLEIHGVDAGATGTPQPVIVAGNIIGYTASTYVGTGLEAQLPGPVLNDATVVTKAGVLWFDPPVQNADDTSPRVYAAVHGYGVQGWPGAEIYASRDGGASYTKLGQTNQASTWGLVAVPTVGHPWHTFDETTVIRVQVKEGTLLSKSDAAIYAGENLCMVGQECLQFGVATLVAPNTYDLSHLLRGRRGTEWYTGKHIANELFVMLNGAPVSIELTESDRNKKFLFKVVTYGSDLTKVDAEEVQVIGENTVPWQPVFVDAVDIGTDFKLSWTERPRFDNQLRDYIDGVHDVDFGGYAVIIYNGPTVVRQVIVYEPEFIYTLAMQISDFGAAITRIEKFAVSQVSNKYGGSRPVTVNMI